MSAARRRAAVVLALVPAALAACGNSGGSTTSTAAGADPAVAVTADDKACTLARTELPAGPAAFAVTNKGSSVTEVYVYGGASFDQVVAEVENIGPGTSREMRTTLPSGTYEVACKPGQKGDGIRTRITVSGSAAASSGSARESSSAEGYDREVELSTDGRTITGVPSGARLGEKIEFKLENGAGAPRGLELKDPTGAVAAEVQVAPGQTGEKVVELSKPGDWQVVVEGDGVDDLVGTLPVR